MNEILTNLDPITLICSLTAWLLHHYFDNKFQRKDKKDETQTR